jgi:energy-coupling factor transporter ATP-binding protein EcfA2
MFTEIVVQGFKSLQDVRVELGQVNVFVGANGSGKTNLLEAIGMASAAVDGPVDDQALLRRGVRPGTPLLYQSSFKSIKNTDGITISVTGILGGKTSEYTVEFQSLADAQQQLSMRRAERKLGGEVLVFAADAFTFDLGDYAVFLPDTPTLRGQETDITQRSPVGLAGGQLAEAVGDLLDAKRPKLGTLELDDLLELLDWVDEIDVVPPSRDIVSPSVPTLRNIIRFTDQYMKDGRNQLPAYAASEGALYVLFVLVLALHPRSPRLFAIDNFDQSMHPRLARATARLFCQQMLQTDPPRQALLTTHNPLVLDGLDLRDDRIRLFAVERNTQGATEVHRVQVSDEILQATQEGLSLSNLWVMGRLGGVPDLF